jgi:hypothetical protein
VIPARWPVASRDSGRSALGWIPMNYRNTEMKLDQIVGYFNDEKINLSPAFQRGHVWPLTDRRKLVENIVQGKPIPAIFLYKEASGARYSYNILDGKQRLESLILFIGCRRADLQVANWSKYFFEKRAKSHVDFAIDLPVGRRTFAQLDEAIVRDLREYAIPTIEIYLTDDSKLDEIINLFVDINQQGVPVTRFDVTKAMGSNNKLLQSVFQLIAQSERRQQVEHYKAKANDFTQVLKRLEPIAKLPDGKSQVDRMWQILLEIAMFFQTKRHRKPVDILKNFISISADPKARRALRAMTASEQGQLRNVFRLINRAYKASGLGLTTLATDQTRFYTFVTALISTDLVAQYGEPELIARLQAVARIMDAESVPTSVSKKLATSVRKFVQIASDRTTDTPRREERQKLFLQAIGEAGPSPLSLASSAAAAS